jgi:O-antigen ligase
VTVSIWERTALWLLIIILAWSQFPLGSNREWSWSLLVLLVAVDWAIWIPAFLVDPTPAKRVAKLLAIPGALMIGVLVWAWLQTTNLLPAGWHNPAWDLVSGALGVKADNTVSLNPFTSRTEVMKLASYLAVGWLAAVLAERHENARRLYVAAFAIGAAYATYGILLSAFKTSQITIFEGLPPPYGRDVSGGFVAKNSFATFSGMSLLAGACLLVEAGRHHVVASRGWRTHLRTLVQFATGRGAGWLIGTLTLLGAIIASDSRAGLIATMVGFFAIFILTLIVSARRKNMRWTLLGGAAAAAAMMTLFLINGQTVQQRFESLIETQGTDDVRALLWKPALRAINDRPMVGTGLGTFRDAYQIYAQDFVPYVVDRVHNDYLEFAMGLGIPAASVWVFALLIVTALCIRGALTRRRRRLYAMTAVGASVLVGFHSAFDFSLQMPAVSMLYAILLGVGVGQSLSTKG